MLIRIFTVLATVLMAGVPHNSYASQASCNVRDAIYSKALRKYTSLKSCITKNAINYDIPEWTLLAILKQENGPINGFLVNKSNGSKDYGPTCINDSRFSDLKESGYNHVTPQVIMKNPCAAITVTAYLLKKEWNKEKKFTGTFPKWLTVMANYHYNYRGNHPQIHYTYKNNLQKRLEQFSSIAKDCKYANK